MQSAELSPAQWKKLGQLVTPKLSKYILHQPTPKQTAFLLLDCEEAFYGGAAGGGKSDALLMAALQYVDVPGYSAILFRKSYADLSLPGALMDRAHDWLGGTDAKWNGETKTWSFPSTATLVFGYMENEKDKYRYKSAEFQFVGWDELTQFFITQYVYMFSRLRRLAGSNIPLRVRSASNPGDIGHEFVKQRFMVEGREHGRIFIPAKLSDNKHLDQIEYEKSLMNLDPITRAQLLRGDWTARQAGGIFKREKFKMIDARPVGLKLIRYWDKAATAPDPTDKNDPDYTVGVLMGRDEDGRFVICDVRRKRGAPAETEALVLQTARVDGQAVPIVQEQEPGSAGIEAIDHFSRKVLVGFTFHGDRVTGDDNGAIRCGPFSSQVDAGNVSLVRGPWNSDFLDECEAYPVGHDDQVKAAAGAFTKLVGFEPASSGMAAVSVGASEYQNESRY